MECNKDEATRAKEISETKLTEGDIAGAKKFALKAQNLFPGLEGLSQFMETLDMYVSAETKVNGEVDWYGVLGVDPLADNETLMRHYRKLALSLHPDKNKSVGADGAFKIVSEGWSLLSDKAKKIEYDQKRNLRDTYQKSATGNASMPAGKNGFHIFTHQNNPGLNDQKSAAASQPTQKNSSTPTGKKGFQNPSLNEQKSATASQSTQFPPCPSKPNAFWTVCNRCKMQYEYLRAYLNQNLRCPNCREPFYAAEIPAPPTNGQHSSTPWPPSYQQQQNVNCHMENNKPASGRKPTSGPNTGTLESAGVELINSPNIQQNSFSGPGGFTSVLGSASSAGQNANLVQQVRQILKRGRKEVHTSKSSSSKKTGARLPSNAGSTSGKGKRPIKKSCIEVNVSGTERPSTSGTVKHNRVKELSESQLQIRNLLLAKSRTEIRKKLGEWRVQNALKASEKEGKKMEMEKSKAAVNDEKKDGNKNDVFVDTKNSFQPKNSSLAASNVDSDEKAAEVMLMSVPDPEFYNFDKDRMEKSFSENQVWAAYDDDDGMPRYYAMIHGVISKRPFKMRSSWLNSKNNDELGPLNWVGSGFSKTTGDFRIGKHVSNMNLNSLSHRVKWMKGARGAIQIFPRKGDVWAFYRNWSPDWNKLTPDEVIHKYDMVEVLEDYNERQGVAVAPLVKVAGFKSVFCRHLDPGVVKTISRDKMFCFSHSVPSYILIGQEARNAPTHCLELDPKALPLELLQIITEAEEMEIMKETKKASKEGKAKDDLHAEESGKGNVKKGMNEHFKIVYTRKAKDSKEQEMLKNTSEAKE
ncbi:DnaJ subfamily B member like [Actinidia chinensis var. chinensis]|uniref:DnaJ subfamily B member like n=1 Tax=Actinidia chinensis var. chinensis TaxID=1590841 RepID=A0A2R6QGA4_ACTCC|nr:DnaJ subfamily B member like [Actinidia chinensis var. chinensis]